MALVDMACWLETGGTATTPLGNGTAGAAAVLLGNAALEKGAGGVGVGGGRGRRVYTCVMTRPAGASRGGNPGDGAPRDDGEAAEDAKAARSAGGT